MIKAKYKSYPKYKPSGVEWIGEIPEEWEVRRFRYAVRYNLESLSEATTNSNYEIEYLDIGNINGDGKIISTETLVFKNAPSRARRIVKSGNIVISTVRTYLKAIAFLSEVPDNFIVSTGFTVISCGPKLHSKYSFYFFRSTYFIEQVCKNSKGVSYPAITPSQSPSNLVDIPLTIPPYAEQQAIVYFLDNNIKRIETVIAKQAYMIELLKEKRSALITRAVTNGLSELVSPEDTEFAQWAEPVKHKHCAANGINEIPQDWIVRKIKYSALSQKKKSNQSQNKIALENIESFTGKFVESELPFEGEGIAFDENAILYGKLRPYLCKVFLPKEKGSCVSEFLVLIPIRNISKRRFLFYFFLSFLFTDIINGATFGTKMPRIDWRMIGNFKMALPPIVEQLAIADFLDRETAKIDVLISKIEKQIQLLNEYKQSLITHAVTGKIDVRGEGYA